MALGWPLNGLFFDMPMQIATGIGKIESPARGKPESGLGSSNQDTLNYTVIVARHNVA